MLHQNIGVASKPVVKPGDHVAKGMKIAEADGFVSAALHSPADGTVKKIEPTRTTQGIWQDSIVIVPDQPGRYEDWSCDSVRPRGEEEVAALSANEIVDIVADSGIVGMGGATFPTHVKLTLPEGKIARYVLLNGAECEPYLTCDDILMQEHAREIILGGRLLMKAVGASECIVGIECNKPEAIRVMTEAAASFDDVSVEVLKKKYPQGGEKQLIYALTGETVPEGGLPIDTGCVVDNVATAFAVYDAVYNRIPLSYRVITVTGPDLVGRGNFLVPIGMPLSAVMEFADGVPESTGKIVAGGPMMGQCVSTLDATVTKGMSGLLLLPQDVSVRREVSPCIRCARCVSVCPMGLEPYLLMAQSENGMWEEMRAHSVNNCIECGSCSYICPSSRPLLDFIKLGKRELRKR